MLDRLDETSITVLGAGNGGHAFASLAASKGFQVKLWNRSRNKLKEIKKNKGITSTGLLEGHFPVDVTGSIKEAIKESQLIMIVTTANAHREIAQNIAPYLHEEQIIVLNPGRTGGALEFSHVLKNQGECPNPKIAEAQSLLFVSRSQKPGHVTISGLKRELPVASFPIWHVIDILPLLKQLNEAFCAVETVFDTSFDNIGAMFHPAPLLLNSARCESDEIFYKHYIEGISPTVAKFLEKMDQERTRVADAYGISTTPAVEWLRKVYGSKGKDLYQTLQNTKQYADVLAPSTLNCRYIYEDVPTGLVPLSSLGRMVGIDTPHVDTIINLANCMLETNFIEIGRTIESMGLIGIPIHLLKEYVTFGEEMLNVSKEMARVED
ncbi:MAG: NAD/NADP octopine/nopaline dehydrogenase family protein [Candidatus Hodarchaeales archaeon]|jgi:opine dehydrogenase